MTQVSSVTLNLLLVKYNEIHMCCDFLLTDRGSGKEIDTKTQKLTPFSTPAWSALVGVSGLGELDGQNVGDWVATKVNQLPSDADLDSLLAALKSAEVGLAAVPEARRHHTFMIGAIVNGRSIAAMVSNYQSLNAGAIRAVPGATLEISMQQPRRVRLFAAGSGSDAVRLQDRWELEALAHTGASQLQIQEKLREVNERIADRDIRVSHGCYAASRLSDGSGSARPYLTAKQAGEFLPPQISQQFKAFGINLKPAIDDQGNLQPIRLVEELHASLDMSAGYFKRELARRPRDAELLNNYGVFLKQLNRTREAEAAFREALTIDPASILARQNLAGLLKSNNSTVSEALQIYEDLLTETDAPTEARSDYAVLLDQIGQLDRAEIEHQTAANTGDSVRAKSRYAWFIWRRRGRTPEARVIFDQIIGDSERDAESLLSKAHFEFRELGDLDAAERLFLRALSSEQKNLWGLRNYGDLLLLKGDARSALHYYRRANRILKRKDASLESNEGLALLAVGPPGRAIQRFHRALELDPSLDGARVNLVLALYLAGQADAADHELSELLNRNNLHPGLIFELNVYGALFAPQDKFRRNCKEAAKNMMTKGARLNNITLDILNRHFRKHPEELAFETW